MDEQRVYDEWKELVQLGKLVNQRKKELKAQLKDLDGDYEIYRSPESLERELKMAQQYRSGKTLLEIGTSYGMTRERVRQLIKKVGVTGEKLNRYTRKEKVR